MGGLLVVAAKTLGIAGIENKSCEIADVDGMKAKSGAAVVVRRIAGVAVVNSSLATVDEE
jgi:hypothetical protein